ncbi:hypothetical protein C3K47_17550 [Solitalea longa]|uniref:Glycosyl transferase family 1 domain-containing protein n=1 Tax=Solitalea longa TaxID=2079460 RepID=A0A2S4ZXY0_9SPHI|nr:glycosyltransferase [Solitalea longa]POY34909.1 hypothetical protein C3K47_17550 [Solitalea longa]
MKIAFSPTDHNTNKYSKILVELLEDHKIYAYPLHKVLTQFELFRSVKVFHLNWYESLYSKNVFEKTIEFIRKIIILFILKICSKKIIWTMHNKIPHEGTLLILSKFLINLLTIFSSKIIIHSKISKDFLSISNQKIKSKIEYIPHPNYINIYGGSKRECETHSRDKLNLLFIGAIKPYKNIELLIDVVKIFYDDINLTIAGKPSDDIYKQHLLSYSADIKNIALHLEFISDNDISSYIKNFDLLVLPYDIQSSLNSGTVILAFSYNKSVICPEIGTISDIQEKNHLLTYNYTNNREHTFQLMEKIKYAINLKKDNHTVFEDWGNHMFNYVNINNDKKDVVAKLVKVYDQVTSI